MHKKIKDEKELIEHSVVAIENQLAAKTLLCQKLEEKEHAWLDARTHLEQEIRFCLI